MWWTRLGHAFVASTLIAVACQGPGSPRARDRLTARVHNLHLPIPFAVRFSLGETQPCTIAAADIGTLANLRCINEPVAHAPTRVVLGLASNVRLEIERGPTPDALRAGALLDIAESDTGAIALTHPIDYLIDAIRLGDTSSGAFTDLAGALLARAGSSGNPMDAIESLDDAARAVDVEPRSASARFDVALGLSELGLPNQADSAWSAYNQVDSSSWAQTAQRLQREVRLALRDPPDVPPAIKGWADSLTQLDPQRARRIGWDSLLTGWATAMIRGDDAEGDRDYREAEQLGAALLAHGDDGSLAQATAAINQSLAARSEWSALAQAHVAYANASVQYLRGDYRAAQRGFALALDGGRLSPVLGAWARLFHGASLVYIGRIERGRREIRTAITTSDSLRYPALLGRGHWMLGTTLLRADSLDAAAAQFAAAELAFKRAHERENTGAVQCLLADAEFQIGSPHRYETMQRALRSLLPYRHSVWLHNLLYTSARAAAADGFTNAALYLQREGVAVAGTIDEPISIIEARLSLARLFEETGRLADAQHETARAARALDSLAASYARDWLRADLSLTDVLDGAHGSDADALDAAVDFFTKHRVELRVAPTLLARARLLLSHQDSVAARTDLRRAAALIHRMAGTIRNNADRSALLATSRTVFTELVKLAVADGDIREALIYDRLGERYFGRSASSRVPLASPMRGIRVEYAFIDDSAYAWTESSGAVTLRRWPLTFSRLRRDEQHLLAAVSIHASASVLRVPLGRLYDDLVRPIEALLPRDTESIAIVDNHDLAAIPFAALWDTATKTFVVQHRAIQFVLPTGEGDAITTRTAARTRVFLVADPKVDVVADPELRPLPASREEVRSIAKMYPTSRVSSGDEADLRAVVDGLQWSDVFHFAGHVEYDDRDPESSRLVLAHRTNAGSNMDLTSAAIGAMHLRNIRLAVLSSCRALPGLGKEGQGLAGLASAFLEAGAQGVIVSGWDVSDVSTARMMTTFYQSYAKSSVASQALRTMQLDMLHSSSPELTSPATWAAFRFIRR